MRAEGSSVCGSRKLPLPAALWPRGSFAQGRKPSSEGDEPSSEDGKCASKGRKPGSQARTEGVGSDPKPPVEQVKEPGIAAKQAIRPAAKKAVGGSP